MRNDYLTFRKYEKRDSEKCLSIFDQNCPEYFAPNERKEYEIYLSTSSDHYEVGIYDNEIVAAFGFSFDSKIQRGKVSWIMISGNTRGKGVGASMIQQVDMELSVQQLSGQV